MLEFKGYSCVSRGAISWGAASESNRDWLANLGKYVDSSFKIAAGDRWMSGKAGMTGSFYKKAQESNVVHIQIEESLLALIVTLCTSTSFMPLLLPIRKIMVDNYNYKSHTLLLSLMIFLLYILLQDWSIEKVASALVNVVRTDFLFLYCIKVWDFISMCKFIAPIYFSTTLEAGWAEYSWKYSVRTQHPNYK